MRVRFWGTRGSVPSPGPKTVRYGGNTSCVEIRTDGGGFFIFDSGTGIRELGLQLAQQNGSVSAHLFLGHTHWDHIHGFPFFSPAFLPGNRLVVYGARALDRSLRDVLAGQMHFTYFPVPLGDLRAEIEFVELEPGEIRLDDALVRTRYLNHTAVCMGYRLEADGVAVAYVTDHEPYGPAEDGLRGTSVHDGDRELIEFVRGVDLLIQDAQYTAQEYATHRGWGHGSADYVTDLAVEAGIHQLALFHHEPTHADSDIDRMVDQARARAREAGSTMKVFAAAEGVELTLSRAPYKGRAS
jgi:phosphoribosyl 1,2-cyclic phosphodiesterase